MKNNNKLRLLFTIIGLILLASFIGACGTSPGGSNNGATVNASKTPPVNVPPGANPPQAKGAPNAAVTIEEFADFQCPTCAGMHPKVNEIRATYGDRVRIIFRQFPLQMHPFGYDASCAAEAAGLQGKFWEMQNLLFTNQSTWASDANPRKTFTDYAEKLGLDVQKFSDDMIGIGVKNRVDADIQRGKALGISSTPSFYINGKLYEGSLNDLRNAVDAELKKAEAAKTEQPTSQSQTAPAPASGNSPGNSNSGTNNSDANKITPKKQS